MSVAHPSFKCLLHNCKIRIDSPHLYWYTNIGGDAMFETYQNVNFFRTTYKLNQTLPYHMYQPNPSLIILLKNRNKKGFGGTCIFRGFPGFSAFP